MFLRAVLIFALLLFPAISHAQVPTDVPATADPGRIDMKRQELSDERHRDGVATPMPAVVSADAPTGAENISLRLSAIHVNGATAFTQSDFEKIYGPYIGQDITLDMIWQFSAAITRLYRDNGYFLSRAFVPAQDIDNGTVTINVVEGYIGRVTHADANTQSYITHMATDDLLAQRPTRIDAVESYLLRLNDLPGYEFRGVLAASDDTNMPEGAVDLILETTHEPGQGLVRLDNHGSRYLGPHQLYGYYETSFMPLHKTALSAIASLPLDELKNIALDHDVALTPALTLELGGSLTDAEPGYTLKPLDLKSRSVSWEAALSYQMVRQRTENLSFRLAFGGRNSRSDLADTPFMRDRIVALRMGVSYDVMDDWHGQNLLNATLSRGFDMLGASDDGDPYLSRAAAEPDFTKFEISALRVQALPHNFILQGRVSGQIASKPLYSSEEYGYGGNAFGRAYDSSEITGDEGVSASLELQYNGWAGVEPVGVTPFVFYDIGKIWNKDAGQVSLASAASAGFGLRFNTPYQISGEIGVAFPLTKSIDTPLYGGNGENPRLLFEITKRF